MFNGSLFTREFLLEGIKETENWSGLSDNDFSDIGKSLRSIVALFLKNKNPNEAQTEWDLIYPVLKAIGWSEITVQPNLSKRGRKDVPDALMFLSADAKARAVSETDRWKSFRHGACLVEAKRWERPLDREETGQGTPSSQIINYLSRADVATDGNLIWGILTNGRVWRLYYQLAQSRAEDFLEIDLTDALEIEGYNGGALGIVDKRANSGHLLKLFLLLFGRQAFQPVAARRTFHNEVLEKGRMWEERVAEDLSSVIFDELFPLLVSAIPAEDKKRPDPFTPVYLEEVREGALTLLYRLLFVLFAEDRNLLPDETGSYKNYSLTTLRLEIADGIETRKTFSDRLANFWPRLRNIFTVINEGDNSLGIPPYNGGLFQEGTAPILDRCELPDAVLAKVIYGLSHERATGTPRYINYRDLSVRQLGSIYERILEYVVVDDDGGIGIRLDTFARKGSGSYYTPDDLVRLIVSEAVGPLVDEREAAFIDRASALQSDKRPVPARIEALAAHDPAVAVLDLRVCDPAMGSGHFLVSLVDWLADRVLEAMARAEDAVEWSGEELYRSPLADRIADIRRRIVDAARANDWPIVVEQLEDRHIVRRMILKRCVYGVDKNPMAVELAKVSLWLHTFTVGAPLSFLDHHLRCGDSLFGERLRPAMDWVSSTGSLLINPMVSRAKTAATEMEKIEQLTDADIAEVKASSDSFRELEALTAPLRAVLDLSHALKWIGKLGASEKEALTSLLKGDYGDIDDLLSGRRTAPALSTENGNLLARRKANGEKLSKLDQKRAEGASVEQALVNLIEKVRMAVRTGRFLHWQVAFPGVWSNWESVEPQGGFDAVIGNPPWDRLKFQEVEWFAARKPEIATQARASDREKMVKALKKAKDPLMVEREKAKVAAKTAAALARSSGEYPLLSGGDTNIYSLFVERGLSILSKNGMLGMLTPSGMASDKSVSKFFKEMVTTGRLSTLFDFANRRPKKPSFFPDVLGLLKFCVFVAGAVGRDGMTARCAFFLENVSELEDPERCFSLTAEDFARVNPNTGTAPIFRSKRDAEITRAIYERHPVLVDRSGDDEVKVWPVRYRTMFHMTNDSGLFVTKVELEENGYPIGENRYRMANKDYIPLYVGRMVHQFDHRAASVKVNEKNLHNAALSDKISAEDKANPDYVPTPQYWVPESAVEWPDGAGSVLAFRDTARSTDARTMIAAAIPYSGVGNKLPLLVPDRNGSDYTNWMPLLLANFDAIVFDFVVRQKIHSTNLNWYIVKQLPVVPPDVYDETRFGSRPAADIVRAAVLELTYTAHDMAPFAHDMGHVVGGVVKPPFPWDEDRRLKLRAKLDALYFLLYGIEDRDDVRYIYSTFPIVEKQETKAHGRYLSRDLCLAYINALKAGDPDIEIKLT